MEFQQSTPIHTNLSTLQLSYLLERIVWENMAILTEPNVIWVSIIISTVSINTKQKNILLARLLRSWNLSKEYRERHRGGLYKFIQETYLLSQSDYFR